MLQAVIATGAATAALAKVLAMTVLHSARRAAGFEPRPAKPTSSLC